MQLLHQEDMDDPPSTMYLDKSATLQKCVGYFEYKIKKSSPENSNKVEM